LGKKGESTLGNMLMVDSTRSARKSVRGGGDRGYLTKMGRRNWVSRKILSHDDRGYEELKEEKKRKAFPQGPLERWKGASQKKKGPPGLREGIKDIYTRYPGKSKGTILWGVLRRSKRGKVREKEFPRERKDINKARGLMGGRIEGAERWLKRGA